MLIDFHTHTTASDGALTPAELLDRAAERGVGLLAITDHDTDAGYRAACTLRDNYPDVSLIPGVELSCRWSGTTIHIVGLGVDFDHPAMREALAYLNKARAERGTIIASRLESRGYHGALEGALAEAGESQLGRPHFSAWMVKEGHVKDPQAAFDKYLGQGKPGDVKACWPELAEVVGWIVAAGGVAVLAHPLKYKFTRMKLRRLVLDFIAAGGSAIEVLSGRQTADQVAQLQRLAGEFELLSSAGSDFHRDGPYNPEIGVELRRLEGRAAVWQRWQAVDEGQQ
ncbi:PHP domain-containing protein [Pseudohalioglobus lutimaris]|uniref:PHP domain-containing protein n=1 Tax=Pseudohalioglobus lutimaris TaxID=1737061 RepID=A0A2N5X5K6_9GAMM|nr:PHP domain-containing protein [Pseudohalioglobus lutimaris]PLW69751.1 PHP domain-containing protein [Pseudohalioglobus lutimaris]